MEGRNQEYVKACIYRYFPRIPETSLLAILKRIRLKDSGSDGRSVELENEVEIRLAVNAHIRHEFTEYDLLCKEARANNPNSNIMILRDLVYDKVKRVAESWRAEALSVTNGVRNDASKQIDPMTMSASKAETLIRPFQKLDLDGKKTTSMLPNNNEGDKLTMVSSALDNAIEKTYKEKQRISRRQDDDQMIIDDDNMITEDDDMIIDDVDSNTITDDIRTTTCTRRIRKRAE